MAENTRIEKAVCEAISIPGHENIVSSAAEVKRQNVKKISDQ